MSATATTAEDVRRGHGHPWLTLLAVSLGLMMVTIDGTVVSIANATIGEDLEASLSGLQWVTNGYLLAVATGMVIGGKLGDLYGRKRIFLLGVVLFALTSLGCGLSSSIGMLVSFRLLQGLAGALMMPGTLSILAATFPPQKLQMAIGIWAGASSVSTASGPIVGGLLVEHVNWQSIFFINLGFGAVTLALGLWVIAESRAERPEGLDVPGAGLLALALFLLVWGIVKSPVHGWGSAYTLGFLAASAAVFALWAYRMRTAKWPLVPLKLFRNRTLDAGLFLSLSVVFALYGVLFFLTLYLQRVQGLSPVEAGVRMLPLTAVLAISAPVGGLLGHVISLRFQLTGGLLIVAGGLLGLVGIEPDSGFIAIWPWFLLMGVGMGFVFTAASQAIVGSSPVDDVGLASGLQQTTFQVGGALGTSVLGAILTSRIASLIGGSLASHDVPAASAAKVAEHPEAIAQGVVPIPAGTARAVEDAIVAGAHEALTQGMHVAFVVAAGVVLAAAVVAFVFVRVEPGEHAALPV